MSFRSILFVPGDRPDRFQKALNSDADALILDLEDSVAISKKPDARIAVSEFLRAPHSKPLFVRLNPISTDHFMQDVKALSGVKPDGYVLPKAEGPNDITNLANILGSNNAPILPVATETPRGVFELGNYSKVAPHLAGITWGAEDLPAEIGAETSRLENGNYTPPFETVRSLALLGAHAAGVRAIETVYPNIKDLDGLAAYAARGRRDGFSGMMAIHPSQCAIINQAFSPSEKEITRAKAIVSAFEENPEAGALQLDGEMIDAPHLKLAKQILERVEVKN